MLVSESPKEKVAAGSALDSRDQKQRVRRMFDAVAPRYDFLNHVLSGGIDILWRKRTIRELNLGTGDCVLDLCTGTGDLGFEALKHHPGLCVIGVDMARGMLTRGKDKTRADRSCLFVQGDAEKLPLADHSVDAAAVGFGIRNVADLNCALAEAARVIRPGGRFAILEFTRPPNPVFRKLYETYFHHVLPRIGGWVSGHPDAYSYLPESVARFPGPADLAWAMRDAGFARVEWSLLHGGIAALHIGHR